MSSNPTLQAIGFLIIATVLEVSGDATVRIALKDYAGLGAIRLSLFGLGAALVFGYAAFLNMAPLEFRDVVGLYIATLFIVWQVVNYAFFRTTPTLPVLAGGALIVIGGGCPGPRSQSRRATERPGPMLSPIIVQTAIGLRTRSR